MARSALPIELEALAQPIHQLDPRSKKAPQSGQSHKYRPAANNALIYKAI
jgi:hypothetical protein